LKSLSIATLALLLAAAPAALAQAGDAPSPPAPAPDGEALLRYQTQSVELAGYGVLQTQAAVLTGDDNLLANGDLAERPGFRIRRGRLGIEGRLYGRAAFGLAFEGTQTDAALLDAWLGYWVAPEFGFTVGAQKLPFSRFALTGSTRGALIERPLGVEAMAPFRQMGLTLQGNIANGMLRYAVGIYDGFERRANFHQGYVENLGLRGNRFNGMAFAGRLETQPLGPLGPYLADLRTTGERSAPLLGVGGAFYYEDGETTRSMGAEGDLLFKIYGLHLAFEYLWDTAEPSSTPTTTMTIPAETTRTALVAELGYAFQMRSQPLAFGGAFRMELLDDNTAIEDSGDALVLTGGLAAYWHKHHLKASLDYTHRAERHGLALDNDTLLLQLQLAL